MTQSTKVTNLFAEPEEIIVKTSIKTDREKLGSICGSHATVIFEKFTQIIEEAEENDEEAMELQHHFIDSFNSTKLAVSFIERFIDRDALLKETKWYKDIDCKVAKSIKSSVSSTISGRRKRPRTMDNALEVLEKQIMLYVINIWFPPLKQNGLGKRGETPAELLSDCTNELTKDLLTKDPILLEKRISAVASKRSMFIKKCEEANVNHLEHDDYFMLEESLKTLRSYRRSDDLTREQIILTEYLLKEGKTVEELKVAECKVLLRSMIPEGFDDMLSASLEEHDQ